MADSKEKLFSDFAPASTEAWMEKVTADLKGADYEKKLVWKTNEGFKVKPFYRMEDLEGLKTTDALPGVFPYLRGTKKESNAWLVRQEIKVESAKEANAKALDILNKGIDSLSFRIKAKDLDEVGQMLLGLVKELQDFQPTEQKGFFAVFKKPVNHVSMMKSKYSSVEANINSICESLESHQIALIKDITLLDKMYDRNLEYYKEINMYIIAGRQKLDEINKNEIPRLRQAALESGRPEDAQAANHYADLANRFDKKLHDLALTKAISLQMGPQIRLVQSADSALVEKIQTSLMNTIPLWKNQMVLTLGIQHSKQALQAQRKVTDITNELLQKNAELLNVNTIETAKEAERGLVDIATLKQTNELLIATLDEVIRIQSEGRENRRLAEAELRDMENRLKMKLLEIKDGQQIAE